MSRSQITEVSQPTVRFGLFLEDNREPLKYVKQGMTRSVLDFRNIELEASWLEDGREGNGKGAQLRD